MWIGGLTRDVLGACNQVTHTGVLLLVVVAVSGGASH
jgi:cobalamin synthase